MALGLGIGMTGVLGLLVIALYSRLAGLRAQVQNGWRASDASGPIDVARQESGLSHVLARFFAVAANYPVLEVNKHARTFPSSMLASVFRFRAAELCDTTEVSERRAPAVELSMRS